MSRAACSNICEPYAQCGVTACRQWLRSGHLMNARKRRCSERLLALVAWPNSVRGFRRRSPLESWRCRNVLSVSFTPVQGVPTAEANTLDSSQPSWMRRCSLAAQTRLDQHSTTSDEGWSCLPANAAAPPAAPWPLSNRRLLQCLMSTQLPCGHDGGRRWHTRRGLLPTGSQPVMPVVSASEPHPPGLLYLRVLPDQPTTLPQVMLPPSAAWLVASPVTPSSPPSPTPRGQKQTVRQACHAAHLPCLPHFPHWRPHMLSGLPVARKLWPLLPPAAAPPVRPAESAGRVRLRLASRVLSMLVARMSIASMVPSSFSSAVSQASLTRMSTSSPNPSSCMRAAWRRALSSGHETVGSGWQACCSSSTNLNQQLTSCLHAASMQAQGGGGKTSLQVAAEAAYLASWASSAGRAWVVDGQTGPYTRASLMHICSKPYILRHMPLLHDADRAKRCFKSGNVDAVSRTAQSPAQSLPDKQGDVGPLQLDGAMHMTRLPAGSWLGLWQQRLQHVQDKSCVSTFVSPAK